MDRRIDEFDEMDRMRMGDCCPLLPCGASNTMHFSVRRFIPVDSKVSVDRRPVRSRSQPRPQSRPWSQACSKRKQPRDETSLLRYDLTVRRWREQTDCTGRSAGRRMVVPILTRALPSHQAMAALTLESCNAGILHQHTLAVQIRGEKICQRDEGNMQYCQRPQWEQLVWATQHAKAANNILGSSQPHALRHKSSSRR